MIKTTDFKKQIGKLFGQAMRSFGFKGTGFEYFKETEEFLFAIYIEAGRWGGKKCTAGFAIHPKVIDRDSEGPLNLKKIKIYQYSLKMNLTSFARGEWWDYSDYEVENLETITKIIAIIKDTAFPVINQFSIKPNFLDNYEIFDLDDFYNSWTKKTGVFISSSPLIFAWILTKYFETKDNKKSKQFAQWGLKKSKQNNRIWYGQEDFERAAAT